MSFWNAFEALFKAIDVPEAQAAQVRGEQIAAFKAMLPFGIAASALNASVIFSYAVAFTPRQSVWVWSAVMTLALLASLPMVLRIKNSKNQVHPRPANAMNAPVLHAAVFGTIWGIAPLMIMPNGTLAEHVLLTTLCAGMMCGGAYIFSTLPRAAAAFVSAIAIGLAGGVILSNLGDSKVSMLLLLASYSVMLFRGAYWNYANHVRSWLQKVELNDQKIELANQNEVINLLLKDFEQTASDCLWETDQDANLVRTSADLRKRLLMDKSAPKETKLQTILFNAGAEQDQLDVVFGQAREQSFFRDYVVRLCISGEERFLSFSGKRKPEGGYRGVVADVTDAQAAEAKIRHMALNDSLTNLANREQLKTELETAFAQGERFGVLCLDLDRFKIINDVHGHIVGDAVLVACADRMRACAGPDDVIARVGGDEFTMLHRLSEDGQSIHRLAEHLVTSFERPIRIDDLIVQVGTSVGIALYPDCATDSHTLLKNADLALYRAKESGRSQVCTFDQSMDTEASERQELEVDLREAIRGGQFKLYFQPLVNSQTRKTIGFEALLRWQHPVKGLLAPEGFIDVAEQTGMISTIGEWVIREALKEAALWTDKQRISVNLSPLQVKSPTLVSTVVNALAATGVAPARLEFEITESVLLDEADGALKSLHELHDMGVRISLDDFGTGYSSLSYLSSFPFDKIKIDKSFVQSIDDSSECRAIVRAVAGLADSLGMISTAEGVETIDQIDSVLAEGCTEMQGFYFSEPQAPEVLEKAGLLRREKRNVSGLETPVATLDTAPAETASANVLPEDEARKG